LGPAATCESGGTLSEGPGNTIPIRDDCPAAGCAALVACVSVAEWVELPAGELTGFGQWAGAGITVERPTAKEAFEAVAAQGSVTMRT